MSGIGQRNNGNGGETAARHEALLEPQALRHPGQSLRHAAADRGDGPRRRRACRSSTTRPRKTKPKSCWRCIISEDLKSQPRSVPLGTLRDVIQERGEPPLDPAPREPARRHLARESWRPPETRREPPAPRAPAPAPSAPAGRCRPTRRGEAERSLHRDPGIVEPDARPVATRHRRADPRRILPGAGICRVR